MSEQARCFDGGSGCLGARWANSEAAGVIAAAASIAPSVFWSNSAGIN